MLPILGPDSTEIEFYLDSKISYRELDSEELDINSLIS